MAKQKKYTIPAYSPVRDPLVVALICGATKSGVHKDQRKEASRKACRGRVSRDSE